MRDADFPSGAAAVRDDGDLERSRVRLGRRIGIGVVVAVLVLVAYGAWGAYGEHVDAMQTLGRINEIRAVRTLAVQSTDKASTLSLPGTMEPFDVATIYARATGYVSKRIADFGTKVHAGDTLAVIAAPDLDQQLSQGRAQLVQAQASLNQSQSAATLQKATNERTQKLVADGWATKQQGDTDRLTLDADLAAVRVADANVQAAKANLERLQQLTGFETITAPFDGVVTDRQIDVGSLVTADASTGTPMFSIERTTKMRVQVYVPQDSVFGIAEGSAAEVTVPELAGRSFKGTISRTASALQQGTRTLLIQVDVDNTDGMLRSGLYCKVGFTVPQAEPRVAVPSEAIIFDKRGLSVAVMEDGKAHIRPIDVAQDNGAEVLIKGGLKPGDQVILSPPVNLEDGMAVKKAEEKPGQPG